MRGTRDPQDARDFYVKEFADYRRKKPTPYMQGLRFIGRAADTSDPDRRILSDEDLESAEQEGKAAA